ncbi:MAG: DUF2142 domain-containing protein [Clostridia bacterium]|nr:DUF2142 domain-containing protein [Clostridia bacterium]
MKKKRLCLVIALVLLAAVSLAAAYAIPWRSDRDYKKNDTFQHINAGWKAAEDGTFSVTMDVQLDPTVMESLTVTFDTPAESPLQVELTIQGRDAVEAVIPAGESACTIPVGGWADAYRLTVSGITADPEETELPLLTVDHGAMPNLRVLYFLLPLLWGLAFIIYFAWGKAPKMHMVCLSVLLSVGTMLVMVKGVTMFYLWDEPIHFSNVLCMAGLEGGGGNGYFARFSLWNTGYFPYAAGMAVSNLLGLSLLTGYRVSLLCNVAFYSMLCTLAVKHAPKYKMTFLCLGCMPICTMLASSFSYDSMVIGGLLLGTALVLEELYSPRKITGGKMMAMVIAFGILTLCKQAYSIMLLLMLLLPESKFESRKQRKLFRLYVVLFFVLCMASLALPDSYGDQKGGDARFANTDSMGQIALMLKEPVHFFKAFMHELRQDGPGFFIETPTMWCVWGESAKLGLLAFLLMFFIAPLYRDAQEPSVGLRGKTRLVLLLLFIAPIL